MLVPTLDLSPQNDVLITVDFPLCGSTARVPVPERWEEPLGTFTCDEELGGCGAEFELTVSFHG